MKAPRSVLLTTAVGATVLFAGCANGTGDDESGSSGTTVASVVEDAAEPSTTGDREPIAITPGSERSAMPAPADNFTGQVTVSPLFSPNNVRTSGGADVTFEPGARTAWHTHPAGQTLIVTDGTGWVQEWGGERREMVAGDVVWIPEGVKHWHGATPTDQMTHTALQEGVDGSSVTWLEQVTDQQYQP